MDTEIKWQCIGGWAFLLLGLSLFLIIPGTVLLGIYGDLGVWDTWTDEQVLGVVFFSMSMTFLLIGCILLTVWCLNTTNAKPNELLKDTEAGAEASGENQNGKPKTNGTVQ